MITERRKETALGFAPHSGWAVVVGVGGNAAKPEVLLRARVEMADPALRGSKQPYHAVGRLPLEEAARRLKRFEESAQAMAYETLCSVTTKLRGSGYMPTVAGILESSGRKGDPLESILASHALIHTADGNHFREALAHACTRSEIAVHRVRSRELLDLATVALGMRGERIQASVQALGRSLGPPWDSDHKSAALVAWMLLADKTKNRGFGTGSR